MNEIKRPFGSNNSPNTCFDLWSLGPRQYNPHCTCNKCDNKQFNCVKKDINADLVANQFLFEYYRKVSNVGWNSVMYLFDQNCNVIVKNKKVGNAHQMLNYFSTEYIKGANYDKLKANWIVLSREKLLINVFGQFQLVAFNGQISKIVPFTETFVLTIQQDVNIKCTDHILEF